VKLVKLGIISFVIFFLLITAMSLFIPSTVRISRAVLINSNKQELMTHISDPAMWKAWIPGMDTAQPFYEDGQVKGMLLNRDKLKYLRIREVKDNEVIADYAGLQQSISTGWVLHPEQGIVSIQWYMDFKLKWYPWEKFASLLFEKRYGSRLETGLERLKKIIESK
jgi:hypothetical protein